MRRIKQSIKCSPFGMVMPRREYAAEEYKFGFNGKEKELNTFETNISFEMRIYNARIGKFFSVDPLCHKYPHLSTYSFAKNTPIQQIDYLGLEPGEAQHGEKRESKYNDQKGTLKECIEYWDATANAGESFGAWVDYNPIPYSSQSSIENKILINNNDIVYFKSEIIQLNQALAKIEQHHSDINKLLHDAEILLAGLSELEARHKTVENDIYLVKEQRTITRTISTIDHTASTITGNELAGIIAVTSSSPDIRKLLATGATAAIIEAYMIYQFISEERQPQIKLVDEIITSILLYKILDWDMAEKAAIEQGYEGAEDLKEAHGVGSDYNIYRDSKSGKLRLYPNNNPSNKDKKPIDILPNE